MDPTPLGVEQIAGGVVAVVVTHRRATEFRRLLERLGSSTQPLLGCVVADHSPTGEIKAIASAAAVRTVVLEDASNPGPGAGWANATKEAFRQFGLEVTAIWYLDDDVLPAPEALKICLKEMALGKAEAIAPLLEDEHGGLWGFPEPETTSLQRLIRLAKTPKEARELLGDEPLPFCWCTGACFLVSRGMIDRAGLHRDDFWLLGEDLEYSMRIAATGRAVFTTKVSVPHLPPPASDPPTARRADYLKFCSLLQNLSYLSFHSPHSRHMKNYLPGNFRRFFRTHGLNSQTIRDAVACLWNGAAKAQPSGTPSGETLRERMLSYEWR
ncbi:hypothetical protein BH09VER1_BH09VER1_00310 [soil metagenome]